MTETNKEVVIVQRSYLSDDLIIHEILTRLPVKSVLRFKSVSKLWYSTFSSSKFATFHLMKSPFSSPSAPVNTLFIESYKDCYLFSYDDDQNSGNLEDNLVKLEIDFGVKDYLKFTGCCNGLICFSRPSGEYFFLWNPATSKLRKYASDGHLKHSDILDYPYVAHGFGYTSTDDDYKYVQVVMTSSYLTEPPSSSNIVYIFSLRENKWRKIDFHDDVAFIYGQPVLHHEKLYWAGYSKEAGRNFNGIIVCFDLGVEKLDIIKLNDSFVYFGLGIMGGCLGKCNSNSKNTGEFIMHIQESTTIQKSFVLPKEILLGVRSQMIGYTSTGRFFVTGKSNDGVGRTQGGSRMLWLVDSVMKPMQCTTDLKFNASINIARYVPSLVSPFSNEELSEG